MTPNPTEGKLTEAEIEGVKHTPAGKLKFKFDKIQVLCQMAHEYLKLTEGDKP